MAQHQHLLGVLRDELHVVGKHHHGVPLAPQLSQHLQEPRRLYAVLAEGGLVEEEDGLSAHQHGGHAQAPFLALAQRERVGSAQPLEAEAAQRRLNESLLLRAQRAPSGLRQTVGDLPAYRVGDELVLRVLKDVAHRGTQGAGGERRYVDPPEVHRPARRPYHAGEERGQGALARAVLADQRGELTAAQAKRQVVEHHVPGGVGEAESPHGQDLLGAGQSLFTPGAGHQPALLAEAGRGRRSRSTSPGVSASAETASRTVRGSPATSQPICRSWRASTAGWGRQMPICSTPSPAS